MKKTTLLRLLATACIALPVALHAHAFLDHASPRVGSTGPAPAQLILSMTEDLEPVFCRVQVFDAQGSEIDAKDARITGATMTLPLPKLAPGLYRVKWKAVATDTHVTTGTFTFTVQAGA